MPFISIGRRDFMQIGILSGQRVWKRQPLGGLMGLGTSPSMPASAARSEVNKLDQLVVPCAGNADYQATRPVELLYRATNQNFV